MNKIIIFKSDMIGDLINFSPCLKIIKDNIKNSHITLICSDYNFQVAKNYTYIDEFIIFKRKSLFKNILKNFKKLYLNKYDFLFQFDGKNSSYVISYFIKSKIKSTICFIKHKKIFNFHYLKYRPAQYLLKTFYNNYIYCDENYTHQENVESRVHYQTNYFSLLEKLNFKITNKKNLFFLDKDYQDQYNIFYKKFLNYKFCLFHFDEKWNNLNSQDYQNSLKIINYLSKKFKIIITTGVKNFIFLKNLKENFFSVNYINNSFLFTDDIHKNNIFLLDKLPLNLLAYFIKNSEINLSFHSGPIVHISPAFDRQIIDLLPRTKNNELDRWIPTVSKYKRINFENITEEVIENI